MKKKAYILTVLTAVVILRLADLFFFDKDPLFYLSPRNYNGQGLLIRPSVIDFLIPLTVIFALGRFWKLPSFDIRRMVKPLVYAFIIIMAPITAGFLLSNYAQETYTGFDFNLTLFLRYILFVLTFISINIFADALTVKNKLVKYVLLLVFLLSVAYTQDIFLAKNKVFILLGLLNSVGVSTVLLAAGLRKIYKQYPGESILAAALAGIILVFFRFNVISQSFFTILLPFAAFLTVTLALYRFRDLKTKLIVISIPYIIAIFLNFALPSLLPDAIAAKMIEKVDDDDYFVEKTGGITVKYKDKKLRDIALKMAKVLDKANEVSREHFGFSPEVTELELRGIAPGGFRAMFPAKISGYIISDKYLEKCDDSLFLNDPQLQPNFPDPVNGILHEYSHLYGVVPYYKWLPGAEEEGWATYSATRLSKLLHRKYGDSLWSPAYNYAAQAGKITARNLSGKAVPWSHANEYGGFNLWYNTGKELGIKKLYEKRWQNTVHDNIGDLLYYSDPGKAKKLVDAFGKDIFLKYGQLPPKKFGEIYSQDDYMYMAKTCGMDTARIKMIFEHAKEKLIDPSIPLPE